MVKVEEDVGRAEDLSPVQSRQRVIVVYLIGFIDLLGVSMMIPLLPKVVHNLGASRSLAGLIGSLYGAIQIFSSPIVGKMSDEYGRKNILLLSYFGSCLGYFCLGYSGTVTMFILARIPSGLFKHGISISKAYLVDISKPDDRPSMLGYYNAISSSGFIVGPLIAGYLADLDPTFQLSIIVGAATFGLNFFIVLFFLPPLKPDLLKQGQNEKFKPKPESYSLLFDFDQLYNVLNIFKGFHWRDMKGIIVIRFLGIMAMMVFRYNLPIFLEESFPLNNANLGMVLSYSGITAAIASATCGILSKRYAGFSNHALRGFALLFLSLVLISLSPTMLLVFACLFLLSLATSYLRITMLGIMLALGRADEKGAILGFSYSLTSFSRMLAPSIVGVAQEFGSMACCWFAAILALAGLVGVAFIGQGKNATYSDKKNE